MPGVSLAARSTASTISAAAARASRRRCIGTVPAWPATPVTSMVKRDAPLIAVTMPTRQVLRLQHRPLLDMDLDIAQHVIGPARSVGYPGGIAAELLQRFAQADAVGVAHVQGRRVEGPRHGARAVQRHREAHAFLVAEGQHLDREGQALEPAVKRGNRRDRGDDAQVAVVLAGVPHGVDVGADQQGRQAGFDPLVAADDVADGVDPRLHPRFPHPGEHLERRRLVLRRQVQSGQPSRFLGEAGESFEPVERRRLPPIWCRSWWFPPPGTAAVTAAVPHSFLLYPGQVGSGVGPSPFSAIFRRPRSSRATASPLCPFISLT